MRHRPAWTLACTRPRPMLSRVMAASILLSGTAPSCSSVLSDERQLFWGMRTLSGLWPQESPPTGTGREASNRLSPAVYHWWARTVSNRRHLLCKSSALPLSYAPVDEPTGYMAPAPRRQSVARERGPGPGPERGPRQRPRPGPPRGPRPGSPPPRCAEPPGDRLRPPAPGMRTPSSSRPRSGRTGGRAGRQTARQARIRGISPPRDGSRPDRTGVVALHTVRAHSAVRGAASQPLRRGTRSP